MYRSRGGVAPATSCVLFGQERGTHYLAFDDLTEVPSKVWEHEIAWIPWVGRRVTSRTSPPLPSPPTTYRKAIHEQTRLQQTKRSQRAIDFLGCSAVAMTTPITLQYLEAWSGANTDGHAPLTLPHHRLAPYRSSAAHGRTCNYSAWRFFLLEGYVRQF